MRRTAAPGEFRSNLHRGGTAERVKLTPEERSTAVRAASSRTATWARSTPRRTIPTSGVCGSEAISGHRAG